MNLKKGIIATLIVVGVGMAWLYYTMVGAGQNINAGFGLTSGLAAVKLPGGYSMANVVLFVVFLVIIAVLAFLLPRKKTR
jgi:hypothetical protein